MRRRLFVASLVLAAAIGVPAALAATHQAGAKAAGHRGGTLKLLYQGAFGSWDPQIDYTLEGWQLKQATKTFRDDIAGKVKTVPWEDIERIFAEALAKDWLQRYDPTRARFRTFLRVCIDRFASNALSASRRLKRRP